MDSIIVYYSLNGNTKQTAEKIAEITGSDLLCISPRKPFPDSGAKKFIFGGKSAVMGETPELLPYEFNADRYDTVIIGSPVWAATFAPPIRTFIAENKDKLSKKRLAAFVCQSGNGAEKTFSKMKAFIGTDKFAAELVLIDPKDRPSENNIGKINDFCNALK